MISIRWLIAGLLLLVSIVNYIDRQALAILAKTIQEELRLTDADYGNVIVAFQVCYAVVYLLAGRLVDRFGPRIMETAFVLWWSAANVLTGFAAGFHSLLGCRALLGLGEPGHYAVAAKAVAAWFPAREKGIAVGMYMMGGTLGAAIAVPLIDSIAKAHGWRSAFIATGAIGFLLGLAWWALYRAPAEHPRLGKKERAMLAEAGLFEGRAAAPAMPFARVIAWSPLWIVVAARMLTDPAWYFYLNWFVKFLQQVPAHQQIGIRQTAWIFLAADLGCVLGGWIAGRLIRRGFAPVRARLTIMSAAAGVMSLSFVLPRMPSGALLIAAASVSACAIMVFMTGCVALPIDIFPPGSLGSVQGLIGTGGAVGGIISTKLVVWIIGAEGYGAIFRYMATLYPLALVLLLALLPRAVAKFRAQNCGIGAVA